MELPYHHCPHGWVEIEFDGVAYIYDTEYAYRYFKDHLEYSGFYKMNQEERLRFGYLRSLDEHPEPFSVGPSS